MSEMISSNAARIPSPGSIARGSARRTGAAGTSGYTPKKHGADIAEGIEHQAEGIGMGVWQLDFFIVPVAMLVGRIFGGIPVVGPYIRTFFSGPLLSTSRALAATKLGEFTKFPGNLFHEWGKFAEQVHGENHGLTKLFRGAGSTLGENITKQAAASRAATAENFTKELLNEFAHGKAPDTFATRRAAKLRGKHVEKMAAETESMLEALAKPHNGFATQMKEGTSNFFKDAKAFVTRTKSTRVDIPAVHEVPSEFSAVHREASNLLRSVKDVPAEKVDFGHVMGRLEGLQHELHAASEAGVANRSIATRAGSLHQQLQTLASHGESAVFQHARANGAPMNRYAQHALKNARNISMGSAVMKGGFVAMSGGMAAKTTLHVKDHLVNLKHLYAEVSGKPVERVSTFEVLFSNQVPEVVKQARGGLMKKFGPELLADAGSLTMNTHFLLNKGSIALGMGGMFVQMMAGNFTDGNDLLETYGQIREMEKAGADVPEEMYAKLIGTGSKKAAEHGGEANLLVKRMAHEYKEQGLASAVIIKEITDGKPFDERAKHIQKEIADERQAAKEQGLEELKKHKDSPAGKILASHAAAVADKPAAAINDNAPSLKVGGNMQHDGKLAEAHREVSGA